VLGLGFGGLGLLEVLIGDAREEGLVLRVKRTLILLSGCVEAFSGDLCEPRLLSLVWLLRLLHPSAPIRA
jgi:hypothetical protein